MTKPSVNKDLCPKNLYHQGIMRGRFTPLSTTDYKLQKTEYSCPRLDAGTFGTMGVGLGFAIATALYVKRFDPGAKVSCDWWRAGHNTRL